MQIGRGLLFSENHKVNVSFPTYGSRWALLGQLTKTLGSRYPWPVQIGVTCKLGQEPLIPQKHANIGRCSMQIGQEPLFLENHKLNVSF